MGEGIGSLFSFSLFIDESFETMCGQEPLQLGGLMILTLFLHLLKIIKSAIIKGNKMSSASLQPPMVIIGMLNGMIGGVILVLPLLVLQSG